jgi:hypothetical protein
MRYAIGCVVTIFYPVSHKQTKIGKIGHLVQMPLLMACVEKTD